MNSQIPVFQAAIQQHLQGDERLLWSGQPAAGIRFRKQDIFLVPFSLMWGGFAIFWEVMAVSLTFGGEQQNEGLPLFAIIFPLFGLPFVIVGLYLIFGRFWVDAKKRKNTLYGITDQRIIILSGLFSRSIKSLNLKTLTDVSMTQKFDGSGDISFGPANPMSMFFIGPWPGSGFARTPCFEMIENVSDVCRIITEVQKNL